MTVDRHHVIKNIYYMLAYVYDFLDQDGISDLSSEDFDNCLDLYAAILDYGIDYLVKRGLHRSYHGQTEPLPRVVGKINFSASMRIEHIISRRIVCDYDEYDMDTPLNRIIKSTIHVLMRSDIEKSHKKSLRAKLPYFSGVTLVSPTSIDWNIRYDRSTSIYRLIIDICHLIISASLISEDSGSFHLMGLTAHEMDRLYEKFLLNFFDREYKGRLTSHVRHVDWATPDSHREKLPLMKTDVTLESRDRVLIIDAKYYNSPLQKREEYSSEKLNSDNLYQLFAYVKNMEHMPRYATKPISGMLLYASVAGQDPLDYHYRICDDDFYARTLDLNQDFSEIRSALDEVASLVI